MIYITNTISKIVCSNSSALKHLFCRQANIYRSILIAFLTMGSVVCVASESQPKLELTDAEQQWLAAHPVVIFTGDPNWLPYEAFNDKGEYIGIVSEHLQLIAKISGLKFQMSPSATWTESTEKAKQGLVDILSETDDSDLASHLNFTDSYVSNPIVIAMLDKEHYVENLKAIKNRTIGVIKDYGYVSKIRRKYKNHKFIVVDDIQDGLVSVSTGRVDALLCTLALCSYTMAQLGLNNVRITGKTEFDTKLALGVQKDLPELLSILNKAIKKITPVQRQAILDGWIHQKFVPETDYTLVYQVIAVAIVLLSIFVFWNRRLSREINLRIATESALKESEARYRSVISAMAEGIVVQDESGQIIAFNASSLRILGLTEDQMLGRTSMDPGWHTIHDDGTPFPGEEHPGSMSLRTGQSFSNVVMGVQRPDETLVWVSINSVPLMREGEDKPFGSVATFKDITQRRKTEQELEEYRNRLEGMVSERTAALEVANKELEAFSYSVSHDLRSPLRSIDGFTYALLEDYEDVIDGDGKNFLRRIRDNAQHMGRLIDAMLSLSRVTRSDYAPKKVNLSTIAQSTIKKYQDEEPDRNIAIEITPDIWSKADKSLVGVVLDNLLGNAWKYTSKTNNPRIEFGATNEEGRVVYYIRDNGIGFDMQYVDKLFNAFQRLHKTEEFEGTGIGLVTVSRIVRRHGGDVWAEAEPGKGATFYFTLSAESKPAESKSESSVKKNKAVIA